MTLHVIDHLGPTRDLFNLLRDNLAGEATAGRDVLVGLGGAPDGILLDSQDRLIDPYVMIYPLPSAWIYGSLEYPEDGANLIYQVTSVGRTYDGCLITADKVRRIIVERNANGSYAYPTPPNPGTTIVRRRQRAFGQLEPEVGRWRSDNTYDLEVQANG